MTENQSQPNLRGDIVRLKFNPGIEAIEKFLSTYDESSIGLSWEPAWAKLGPIFRSEASKTLRGQGKNLISGKAWPDLAESTLAKKAREGQGQKPMIATGALLQDLVSGPSLSTSDSNIKLSPTLEYAYPVHFGESRVGTTIRSVKSLDSTRGRKRKDGTRKRLKGSQVRNALRHEIKKSMRKVPKSLKRQMTRTDREAFALQAIGARAGISKAEGLKVASKGRLPARPFIGQTIGLPQKIQDVMGAVAEEATEKFFKDFVNAK